MKISLRISLILSIISAATIIILTILIHFRYHITRTNLINDRISVTGASINAVMDTNLRIGIPINSQSNIETYIKKYKEMEGIIKDIYVLENKNWNLIPIFKTGSTKLPNAVLAQSSDKMKASKLSEWSFNYTDSNENTNYVGFSIKGITGRVVGAIMIGYDASLLKAQEEKEVGNLYKRMIVAIFVSIFISFLIGYKTTEKLSRIINTLDLALDHLKQNKTHFDLSQISDPTLKGDFRKFLTFSCQVQNDLNKIEKLINLAEEDGHEKDTI